MRRPVRDSPGNRATDGTVAPGGCSSRLPTRSPGGRPPAPRDYSARRVVVPSGPTSQWLAVQRELLDPVVAVLADVEAAIRTDGQVIRITHLAWICAPAAPGAHELATGIEDLDPVIAAIGDIELVLFIERESTRPEEFAGFITVPAPLAEPLALRREDLDAVVLTIFGDVKIVGPVDDHVGGVAESARGCTLHAIANLEEQFAT